jgi:hypothetical protein
MIYPAPTLSCQRYVSCGQSCVSKFDYYLQDCGSALMRSRIQLFTSLGSRIRHFTGIMKCGTGSGSCSSSERCESATAGLHTLLQCGGSAMFIPDPGSVFFPSRIRTVSIPDPGSASKNLSVLTPKKWFLSSRKYDPGCYLPISDPGSRCQKSTGSRIRIRNTAVSASF